MPYDPDFSTRQSQPLIVEIGPDGLKKLKAMQDQDKNQNVNTNTNINKPKDKTRVKKNRGAKENPNAILAFEDYYNMGPDRSLTKLLQKYKDTPPDQAVPTRNMASIGTWSSQYGWQERVAQRTREELERRRRFEEQLEQDDRKKERDARRKTIELFRGRLISGMATLDPKKINYAILIQGLELVLEQSRKEFNDEPETKNRMTVNFEKMSKDDFLDYLATGTGLEKSGSEPDHG